MESDWLTVTKLIPPEPRPDTLRRPRLLVPLQQAIAARPLTLVSAPAGSGKTTLLAALAAETPGHLFAWMSLDDQDNDPLHFVAGMQAALQRSGLATLPAPEGNTPEHLRGWLRSLINTLHTVDTGPVVLVLDDLHWVSTPAIFTLLDQLLDHMPVRLRLVIATRYDPPLNLARLRVRRQLAELRLADLRFTTTEATELLNDTLGLTIAPAQLDQLVGRTEGWAAGVSLLANSLEQIGSLTERTAFLAYVQRTDRAIFEFLAEEVLNRQDPFVRMFLLETAVLPTLTPALCQAVTGRADVEDVLDTLYRRNLFLVEVHGQHSSNDSVLGDDAAPLVYRYHDLFRDFLRLRLRRELPDWPPRLYRRAAAAERNPARRIQLLLTGELWEDAASEIVAAGEGFVQTGSFGLLQRWIDALPSAVREASPRLLLLKGICAWEQYELAEGRTLLEQALRQFTASGDQKGRAAALVQLARSANHMGDTAAARAVASEVAALPSTGDLLERLSAAPVFELLVTGHWRAVLAELDQLIAAVEQERVPERQRHLLQALLPYVPGPITALPGAVPRFEQVGWLLAAHPPTALSEQLRIYALTVHIYCHFWRGNWDAAVAGCAELYRLGEEAGVPAWRTIEVGGILPLCAAYRGDLAAATVELDRLLFWVERIPEAITVQQVPYLFWQARLHWQQRRFDEVRALAQRIAALEQAHGASPFLSTVQPLLRTLIALAERRFDDAEAALRVVAAIQEQMQFSVIFGDAEILLAYLKLKRGRPGEALAQFAPLLAEHERENTPARLMWEGEPALALLRLTVERHTHSTFAEHVLQLLAPPAASGVAVLPTRILLPDSDEALSTRELEVLRLLARGASNSEIAATLVISPHTAKRHVANILAKLDVGTRAEATSRAHQLGLI